LKYDKKETTWQDHGHVQILLGDKVLAEEKKMIHNTGWSSWADLQKKSSTLAEKAIAALPKKEADAPKADAAKKAEEEAKAPEEASKAAA